jgi:signal transduction histidine kinase
MDLDLMNVLNSLAVGVFIVDTSGTVVVANTAGLAILGASSIQQLRPGTPTPFRFPNVRTENGRVIPHEGLPIARALAGEEVVQLVEFIDHESCGTKVLRTRTTRLCDANGTVIGAVKLAVDVTREHDLATIRDEFLRQAAHELKTPVALIRASAEVLGNQDRPSPEQVGALMRGVERIDGLINSLLDLVEVQGGIQNFSRAAVALEQIIDGALARLPPGSRRRVQVTPTSLVIMCDEARMRRALYALIDNALKYSPRTSPVEVSAVRDNKVARIAVRDQGYGIPADKQRFVFDRYFRAHAGTDRDAGGIGVGLYVVREIIRLNHGKIWFESAENRGSVFYVELPVEGA